MNMNLPPNAVTLDLEVLQQVLGGKELDLIILRSQLKRANEQIAQLSQQNGQGAPSA
jgi:hypothetical protein